MLSGLQGLPNRNRNISERSHRAVFSAERKPFSLIVAPIAERTAHRAKWAAQKDRDYARNVSRPDRPIVALATKPTSGQRLSGRVRANQFSPAGVARTKLKRKKKKRKDRKGGANKLAREGGGGKARRVRLPGESNPIRESARVQRLAVFARKKRFNRPTRQDRRRDAGQITLARATLDGFMSSASEDANHPNCHTLRAYYSDPTEGYGPNKRACARARTRGASHGYIPR